MKKLIIIFSLIVLLIPLMPINKVFATVEAPEKPIEVDCPPEYVGQKKCFYVTNPRVKEKTPTTPNAPAREVTPEMNMPEKKEVRRLPDGKKIFNHPYVYALWIAVGGIRAHSETFANIEDKFWNNVNEVDKMAGEIANKVSDTTAAEIQFAWEKALINFGTSTLNLKDSIWNELFGATNEVIAERDAWAQEVNKRWKEVFPGQGAGALDFYMTNYGKDFNSVEVLSMKIRGSYTYMSLLVRLGDRYLSYQFTVYTYDKPRYEWDNFSANWWRTSYQEARDEAIIWNDDETVYPIKPSYSELGTPIGSGVVAPIVPMTPTSIPKVVEIDGKKYYQSPNEVSPAHPDLEPMPELQPDGTQKKIGTKIPGETLVDEDGYPIGRDGTRQPTPITTPITTPLTPTQPEYKVPNPPWNPITPPVTGTPSNCNKCLPDLIPNFFGLFAVFFTFLLACLIYVGKFLVFVITIPMIPQKRFEGPVGSAFEFLKSLEIGGIEIYNSMLALTSLLFSFLVYKIIRRAFNG